jgi:uncharacterized protein DUF4259
MGSWGTGPFDNDDAADFANELGRADPAERLTLIRTALQDALDADYLEVDGGNRAIAAAATVAACRPGGPEVDPGYGPAFLALGDGVAAPPPDLVELAGAALDRVQGEESEWRDLWDEAAGLDDVTAALEPVRAALG